MARFKNILKYLAPFAIIGLAVVFIWNVLTHGQIGHPGKFTYAGKCAQCHGDNGEGIRMLTPPLINSDFAIKNFDSIPCWIKNGMNHPITVNGVVYDQPMYPSELDDIQTANVINFISSEFLKYDTTVNSIWVKEKLKVCEQK